MARATRRADPGRRARDLAVGRYARIDRGRVRRVGVPEVILGEGKTVEHLLGILRTFASRGEGALVSRPTKAQRRALEHVRREGMPIRFLARGRLARLSGPLGTSFRRGTVALVAAGTSDVPVAEEARAVLHELRIETITAYDVGVAGLHRLLGAIARLERARPAIYLAFAGREGALPTVLAGLVRAPVVGVPTSVGYGRGGRGEAALNAMLQSCAPIAVVNIDAAVPAALFAAQGFARPPGRARGPGPPPRRRSFPGPSG
ncbi:MAG: nickel pincer cofactor biosynthesis protein LarB [Thermoplasmata archaeon]